MKDITENGIIIFENFYEKNYPFQGSAQHESGYHFKTQIIFYNDGVKLKMRVNYELWVMETNRFTLGSSTNGNFEIDTISMAYINLKQK
ncbi:hypothetical protein [Spiroplasma endosymbiont of Ammophila pubescens]|uniref:hypothetical protein n=1 Tax=Spiroplasma endosymbiont of Ammophila pubescens TaxID=3066315 RepID=UPI0032B24CCB